MKWFVDWVLADITYLFHIRHYASVETGPTFTLIKHAQNDGIDVILEYNANAHHTLLGSKDINKKRGGAVQVRIVYKP